MEQKKKGKAGKILLIIFASLMGGFAIIGAIVGGSEDATTHVEESTPTECVYNAAIVKAYRVGTDELLDEKTIPGCFVVKTDEMGFVEISSDVIKVSYYKETTPNVIKFLDVKFGESEAVRWRANQGHDLFVNETSEELNFVFGDRIKTKIKGSIQFIR
ncbi:hypothetical protein [Reichenbachiella sp.]|uniref:hypothetical protein n=1 Tax=Reichenbachiella sp. TaxID=2184521 RepID=UPI003B5CFEA8